MEASPIYTFFLVDDDIAFLNLMGRILESRGHKVLMAHSGTSAIIDIPSEKLDCVITDYQMVGMDGIELVRDLRESSAMQNVKIIMVSGETDNAAITEATESGVDGFISKPINPATFVDQIIQILND
jgi:CheY-like chemotaxis protein